MKKWIARILTLVGVVLAPSVAFAQGLDITRAQRGLVSMDVLQHNLISTALVAGGAGESGTVAAYDIDGTSVGITQGTITLTRTGTTGSAVAPPPYPGRILFGVYDNGGNSVITCTGGTIAGIDPYGNFVSETVSGTIDDSPDSSPVLTINAYSDVVKVTFTGCVITSGTTTGDLIKAVVSDWIYPGQKIRTAKQIHKICIHDLDAAPAIPGATGGYECYNGYQIATEKTWANVFHARSNTLDMGTIMSSDTNLFAGAQENIHFETFPFPVSY